ncbi:hypothetical protein ACHAWF_007429 [Thalassiosira exigua]
MKRGPIQNLPRGVKIVVPPPAFEACSAWDKLLVYASSLVVVGSPLWFYGGIIYLYKRWARYRALSLQAKKGNAVADDGSDDENYTSSGECSQERPGNMQRYAKYEKLASKYGTALAVVLLVSLWGPHRSKKLGELLGVRKWRLWDAWLNYVGFTVLQDTGDIDSAVATSNRGKFDLKTSPAIFAFVPHGIFPFGLAFSCLPQRGYDQTWGLFRPVVATATRLFPLVRMFISWMGGVDASRSAVSSFLSQNRDGNLSNPRRLGISPGGIAEMFESYPKPGFHPNDEAALLKHRNGIFKLATEHNVPVVPVYCFGATKMFRRVQLPHFIETLSRALKISLCLLYGKLGLPIPFRQRLTYVIGNAIWPSASNVDISNLPREEFDRRVQEMHRAFCDELVRIFDRNKSYYGWEDKTLRLV